MQKRDDCVHVTCPWEDCRQNFRTILSCRHLMDYMMKTKQMRVIIF